MLKRNSMIAALCVSGPLCLGALLGCGAAVAPEALHNARDALKDAEKSKAPEVAPVRLEEAKQALAKAEAAFEEGEDDEEIASLSYVAERRAELAVAAAANELARREKDDASKEMSRLQGKALEAMNEEQRRLAEAAKKGDAEVARVKAELEKERLARAEAEKKAAAAMASLAEIAKVREEQRGVVITLSGSVLFQTGRHELLPIAREKLNEVARAIQDQGYKRIVVEGHTDSRGAPAANEALSLRRAQEVRSYLISQGIDSSQIEAVGNGSRMPIADNNTPEGRANNRRVEIVLKNN